MMMTRRVGLTGMCLAVLTAAVLAGNAHFVGAPTITIAGDSVTASGKVAGLGNVPQIHVVLSGDAICVNSGSNHPHAANKLSVSAEGDFPVQNGKALFALILEATFQPPCSPPMRVSWSELSIQVTADDGTFLVYP
jgi:hypothetical protein